MKEPQTILVTGGSGFVGSHIVGQLADHGYSVRALMRRAPEKTRHPTVEVVIGDLTRAATYQPALQGAFAVIHAALTDALSFDLAATRELRDASARAGVRKFLHLSSIAVYGNPVEGILTE